MSKTLKDGVWILTREAATPESERHIERDDPLFPLLQTLFEGRHTHVDFNAMTASLGMQPEDAFIDLHENYGYICIGTGENPAINEILTPEQRLQRQASIEKMLEQEKLPHIFVKGKYMGVEENSYFIPFHHQYHGLSDVLQSDVIRKVEKIAETHQQDSLLICQTGYACYLYTTGSQKGNVVAGRSAVVYPEKTALPDDCYSLFISPDNRSTIAFTCALDFTHVYTDIAEFAAAENKALQEHYQDFQTSWETSKHKKVVILLRGTNGYSAYAVKLKNELSACGVHAEIVGSDANIAKVNEASSGWPWPQVRAESLMRNSVIFHELINRDDVDVVIYADMNKTVEFMIPYLDAARALGHKVISHVVNSFVFDPRRSEFAEKLSRQFGVFMARHFADFKSEKGQITGNTIKTDGAEIEQLHSVSTADFAAKIRDMVNNMRLSYGNNDTLYIKRKSSQPAPAETAEVRSNTRNPTRA